MFIVHRAAEKGFICNGCIIAIDEMHQMPEEKPRPLWAAEATYKMHTRRLLRARTFRITPRDARQRLLEKQEWAFGCASLVWSNSSSYHVEGASGHWTRRKRLNNFSSLQPYVWWMWSGEARPWHFWVPRWQSSHIIEPLITLFFGTKGWAREIFWFMLLHGWRKGLLLKMNVLVPWVHIKRYIYMTSQGVLIRGTRQKQIYNTIRQENDHK